MSSPFNPVEVIQEKKRGQVLSRETIRDFLYGYLEGRVEEYQLSALLMAIWFKGLNEEETFALTEVMRDSGRVIDLTSLKRVCVDKHSTGGVGDKTSLILAPLVAAAGVPVPMMAGRGLAHTGGTLDKLEAIPGFRVNLSLEEFKKNVATHGFCIMGQTEEICPADKKIYALRDVTATVDSLPLICASIMSKKLAEGIQALVLDVKTGSGAFMKTPDEARRLALQLKKIGELAGLKVSALITSMYQPLGSFVGNALEVKECIDIMQGLTKISEEGKDLYEDTRELTLQLAAAMIHAGGAAGSIEQGYASARTLLTSGKALELFYKMCEFQGPSNPEALPKSPMVTALTCNSAGYISKMDVELIGRAAVELGAGRLKTSDKVDPAVGFEFLTKLGDSVGKGQELVRIHSSDAKKLESTKQLLAAAIAIAPEPPSKEVLILENI